MVSWKRGKFALRQILMVKMSHMTFIAIQRQCKYADAENQQCSMLSGDDDGDHDDDDDYNDDDDDDDDDGYFEV